MKNFIKIDNYIFNLKKIVSIEKYFSDKIKVTFVADGVKIQEVLLYDSEEDCDSAFDEVWKELSLDKKQ